MNNDNFIGSQIFVLALVISQAITLFLLHECIFECFALGSFKSASCFKKARHIAYKYSLKDRFFQKYMRQYMKTHIEKYNTYMKIKTIYLWYCPISFLFIEILLIFFPCTDQFFLSCYLIIIAIIDFLGSFCFIRDKMFTKEMMQRKAKK